MKKRTFIIIAISILLVIVIATVTISLVQSSLSIYLKPDSISGIENYNKNYYIEEYGGDLDSNLLIFPDDKTNLINPEFSSSFQTGLFDSDGYILLKSKYSEENFNNEIDRIKNLSIIISNGCREGASVYENKIKYDDASYKYPAYVTIDGFGSTYEYALINTDEFEIIYVYLSYPKINASKYKDYLKIDKSEYSKTDTINRYSMYNHSFNDGHSFIEFDDCK